MSETTERPDVLAKVNVMGDKAYCDPWVTRELVAQLTAALQENERLKEELAGEERSRDMHADLNRRSAKALGKPFEGAGSSWHDIPECIAALRSQLASGAEKLRKANESVRMLADEWAQREGTLALKDHLRMLTSRLASEKERGDRLSFMLAIATTRLDIMLGRIRGCGHPSEHGVSEIELPGWIEEQRAALSGDTPTTKEE